MSALFRSETEPTFDLSLSCPSSAVLCRLLKGNALAIVLASDSRCSFSLSSRPFVKNMTRENRNAKIVLKSVYSESKSGISFV